MRNSDVLGTAITRRRSVGTIGQVKGLCRIRIRKILCLMRAVREVGRWVTWLANLANNCFS